MDGWFDSSTYFSTVFQSPQVEGFVIMRDSVQWSVACAWKESHLQWDSRSVRVAERLSLPTSDHGVAGSNPAGGEILPEPKRRFIAQSLSCSPFHHLEMTEILLKGRKTLTHPSIIQWDSNPGPLSLELGVCATGKIWQISIHMPKIAVIILKLELCDFTVGYCDQEIHVKWNSVDSNQKTSFTHLKGRFSNPKEEEENWKFFFKHPFVTTFLFPGIFLTLFLEQVQYLSFWDK